MLRLKRILIDHRISQRALAARFEVSATRIARWCNQEETPRSIDLSTVAPWLVSQGCPADQADRWGEALPADEAAGLWIDTRAVRDRPSAPAPAGTEKATEGKIMLLARHTLTDTAREHWGIQAGRDPFGPTIRGPEDIYWSPDARRAREAVWQMCQRPGGEMMALIGESGSGKTILLRDLEERIAAHAPEVVLIRPYIVDMEDRGGSARRPALTALDIGRRVVRVLDPRAPVRQDRQDRWEQIHDTLRHARRNKRRPVLVIEEAHGLPHATLRHLKRYLELTEGHAELISILLIGQQELGQRLDRMDDRLREVVQRCDPVRLGPIDVHVGDYLNHKVRRAGLDPTAMLAPGCAEAVTAALTVIPRGVRNAAPISLVYPLAVNNLLTLAMNLAVRVKARAVSADLIAEAARQP